LRERNSRKLFWARLGPLIYIWTKLVSYNTSQIKKKVYTFLSQHSPPQFPIPNYNLEMAKI